MSGVSGKFFHFLWLKGEHPWATVFQAPIAGRQHNLTRSSVRPCSVFKLLFPSDQAPHVHPHPGLVTKFEGSHFL